MARPKVFVSSTFYDLKQIRTDLERFIKDMGYDPVLHERGNVPYGSKEKLEEYCYREIHQAELLVSVVGSRFGSQSEHQPYSISQQELKTAYDLGIQVFIFVEAAVLGEYQTYLKNKDVTEATFQVCPRRRPAHLPFSRGNSRPSEQQPDHRLHLGPGHSRLPSGAVGRDVSTLPAE
jgi:hypothetical protein